MTATNLGLLIMFVGFVLLIGLIILAKRVLGKGADTAPHYPSLNDVSAKHPKDHFEDSQLDFLSTDQGDHHKRTNMQRRARLTD